MIQDRRDGEDLSKYIDDIKTIKELLYGVEKRPLYEHWVFWFWGGLAIAGTLVQFFLTASHPLELQDLFLTIWLPIILLIFTGVLIIKSGGRPYLPLVVLLSGSIIFAILAQHGGYSSAFVNSFVLFFLALVLYFSNPPTRILSLVVGLVVGAATIFVGVASKCLDRRER